MTVSYFPGALGMVRGWCALMTPLVQAVVLVPFLYMSLCYYRSLFTLRIFGAFRLQVTPAYSSASRACTLVLTLALAFSLCAITY